MDHNQTPEDRHSYPPPGFDATYLTVQPVDVLHIDWGEGYTRLPFDWLIPLKVKKEPAVYRIRSGGQLIYIGHSGNPGARLRSHWKNWLWEYQDVTGTIEYYSTIWHARAVERLLLAEDPLPPLNGTRRY